MNGDSRRLQGRPPTHHTLTLSIHVQGIETIAPAVAQPLDIVRRKGKKAMKYTRSIFDSQECFYLLLVMVALLLVIAHL